MSDAGGGTDALPSAVPITQDSLSTSAASPSSLTSEVVLGDNLDVMRGLPDGCLDLVYIDPPFGTGRARTLESIRTGQGAGVRAGFGGRTYRFEVVSQRSYSDSMPLREYAGFLRTRLEEIHRLLAPTGSLYVHLDSRVVHYARLALDEIFGPERFLNEIIWAYDYGGRSARRWPRKHDNILWYARSERWTFNPDAIDRLPYMAPGLVTPDKAARGKLPTDVWWMTIVPTSGSERTGYPTQKPLRLLERIVLASSTPGDLVADFFCGSGTTGVAALRHGRRYLLVDDNEEAVAITRQRLAGEAARLAGEAARLAGEAARLADAPGRLAHGGANRGDVAPHSRSGRDGGRRE